MKRNFQLVEIKYKSETTFSIYFLKTDFDSVNNMLLRLCTVTVMLRKTLLRDIGKNDFLLNLRKYNKATTEIYNSLFESSMILKSYLYLYKEHKLIIYTNLKMHL